MMSLLSPGLPTPGARRPPPPRVFFEVASDSQGKPRASIKTRVVSLGTPDAVMELEANDKRFKLTFNPD